LKLIGSDGVTNYPERFISGVDSILVDTIFQGGATISGNIPFIIFIGDSRLALGYDSQSGESYYLSLP
jgi:predicted cation transporter